ncbi:hypothetical protein BI312_03640 [Xanthomonas citri pv. citri]|nr:hypothetical protein BI314_11200 [Xanthomonas citri pv. citri]AZB52585.1 hypothetical protein BHE84_24170 [Xanthomonas citri pv. glycines str. 8ra]QDR47606.1 hypothetical protein FPK90_14640 [Xanthomonas citri pv. glycines]QYF45444.1 hypothetical protein HZS93_02763 [Xanthomonas citri]APR14095.1 hypothetical protein BI315_03715 [Xanthomonas citri pv. citri]
MQPLCAQARQAGCTVRQASRDWSQARRVPEFAQPSPAALRKQCRADASVADAHAPATPHRPGDEGWFCERCLVGMTFPLR